MAELTQQELEDFEYVEGLSTEEEPFVLDLSDERQYRYLIAAHERGGLTPENRPGLFAGLAAAREEHAKNKPVGLAPSADGWESGGAVTDVGIAAGSRSPAANGFTGFLNGAEQVRSWLVVRPAGGSEILSEGFAEELGNGSYVPVVATPEPGKTAPAKMTATLTYSYKLNEQTPWEGASVRRTVTFLGNQDPIVEQPKKEGTLPANKYIQIAIGRGQGPVDDCDYWLAWEPTKVAYYVPLVGHVDFTPAPPPKSKLEYNGNVFIAARLARLTEQKKPLGGTKQLPAAEAKRLFDSIQVSGNTMSWNMPAPPKNHKPDEHGNTLNWGEWPGGNNGELIFLYVNIMVKLTENPDTYGFINIESSFEEEDNPTDGKTLIMPLKFVYSCLALGTPILMADGSWKPFEEVERGEMVRVGDGSERKVTTSRVGRYRGKMLKLGLGETEMVLSRNHLVAREDGTNCPADELKVGDRLKSMDGSVELTGLKEIDFDGHIGNISLTEPEEPTDPARNMLFAGKPGGIQVGDYELQTEMEYRRTRGKEAVLASLDPAYHQDYLNYLEEQAAAG